MAKSFAAQANPGMFVPTTNVWDPSEIFSVDINQPEFKELLVRLYQNLNTISLALNLKDTGYYVQEEFVNGQAFFPNPTLSSTTATNPVHRQVFRKVVNFGALPNNALKSVAHGLTITNTFTFTRIYATASDTTGSNYIPIPYVGTGQIEMFVDGTNVNIRTTSNRTAFTVTYAILEYIKS